MRLLAAATVITMNPSSCHTWEWGWCCALVDSPPTPFLAPQIGHLFFTIADPLLRFSECIECSHDSCSLVWNRDGAAAGFGWQPSGVIHATWLSPPQEGALPWVWMIMAFDGAGRSGPPDELCMKHLSPACVCTGPASQPQCGMQWW